MESIADHFKGQEQEHADARAWMVNALSSTIQTMAAYEQNKRKDMMDILTFLGHRCKDEQSYETVCIVLGHFCNIAQDQDALRLACGKFIDELTDITHKAAKTEIIAEKN